MKNQHAKLGQQLEALRSAISDRLLHSCVKQPEDATDADSLRAMSLATRDVIAKALLATQERERKSNAKRLAYLSMEFLMGRSLENNLLNLGLLEAARLALPKGQPDFERVSDLEPDAALGNGGLGRLAACFLDSLATLGMPGHGYGINYEFGLFQQLIEHGEQRERADPWASASSPWLIPRPGDAVVVPVYGRIEHSAELSGAYNPMWLDWKIIVGVPRDLPVVGYGGKTVNTLRLFSAQASSDFDVEIFNAGDYVRAIGEKISIETVSKVLYPADDIPSGRELRLLQEYFLVACALRDLFRKLVREPDDVKALPEKLAIQLNDTHPALSVAELMRLLVDEHSVPWDEAFRLTERTLAYTNHTLLPEALEKWPVELMERVLPRHMQIIYEINQRFLDRVAKRFPGDSARLARMSVIEEATPKQVRMAHLSIVGSHSVNGVAALHSDLVKSNLVPDFYELWPERFNNKTNGVTPRRWIKLANPGLSALLDKTVSPKWVTDLDSLRALEKHAGDASFRQELSAVKRANKERLAALIRKSLREVVDPASLFDVQIKRIHEYKRQFLNAMHVIHLYLRLKDDGADIGPPRTSIFAGKAAPGYYIAKRVIRLIHDIAAVVNRDPAVRDRLRVIFLPDYRVSLAEQIIPAADLSEQISTAGKEASGTGNMKLMMNGALTIGTLDGANVEIHEEVGDENIFIFGLEAATVERMRCEHSYDPGAYYRDDPSIRRVVDALRSDRFSPGEPGRHGALLDRLFRDGDEYFHLADFSSYAAAQARAGREFQQGELWARKSILNVARSGKFSSDRTIREYAAEIWHLREHA